MQLKRELSWMYDAPAQSLQQTIRDLDSGFKIYDKVKNRKGVGDHIEPPNRFRKRGQGESFRLPQDVSIDVLRKRIKIPKIGELRTRQPLDFPGELRSVTIKFESGKWFAILLMRSEIDPQPTPEYLGSSVGLDRGIVHSIADSDGNFFDMPELKSLYKKKSELQSFLKRKKRGSREYRKLQKHISQISHRIADIRKDFLQKTTTILAKSHGHIVLEDLKVKSMMRSARGTVENPGKNVKQKRGLNRGIGRQGWSMCVGMLEYKLAERGGTIEFVSARNSSRECSICGHISTENRLTQAKFECERCSHSENADINAAKVIRGRALSRNGLASCRSSEFGATTQVPSEILVLA
jgi:putative transposase